MTETLTRVQPPKVTPFSILVAVGASLGGLLYGYDTGIIGSALLFLQDDFGISDDPGLLSVITSITLLGAIFGAIGTGPLSERLGRRWTVVLVAVAFIVFAIGCGLAPNVTVLIIFRFLLGLPVGGASQIIPTYIAELAPKHVRGTQAVLFQVMICVGTLVAYATGHALGTHAAWREMLAFAAIPAVVFLIIMLMLPESPRWLILKSREKDAAQALARVRPAGYDVSAELDEIRSVSEPKTGSWRDLRTPWVRPALVAGLGVAFFSQATGISAIIYYAPSLLALAGFGTSAATLASIGVGVSLLVFTLVGMALLERLGRRKLVLWGLPGAVVVLAVLAMVLPWTAGAGAELSIGLQVLVMICLAGYFAFNGGSLSVMTWLYMAEIFPLEVRGRAVSLCAFCLWVTNFLVTLLLYFAADKLGTGLVFGVLAVVNVIAWLFVWRWVPETKGRSLEEIESSLKGGTFTPRVHIVDASASEEIGARP
ncbi:sugar porter family MFS transporter [Gordonia sp. SL306]|uniref:sugar porter family MFS transporter n=1 Tax=Gordonia sp. SL306 TaxID=2995145 RepID=UPI0022714F45|nr:sugar porter family MFS transporter [Gordonia sp. SL306]WAC57530.1 sugar porter family MFS transporter [Gordonia sp. SL306]